MRLILALLLTALGLFLLGASAVGVLVILAVGGVLAAAGRPLVVWVRGLEAEHQNMSRRG